MLKKILIVDDLDLVLLRLLKPKFVLDYRPEISLEQTLGIINNYEGLIIRSKFNIDKNFLGQLRSLKFIARAGSGVDNIDSKEASKLGIKIINVPEASRDAVAEHTLGLLLALLNNIHLANDQIKNSLWKREANRGIELNNKTIGIIGYGNVGSRLAQLLKNFGLKILAYDKYKHGFSNSCVQESNISEILLESDIISLHIPLTSETKYYVNEEFFESINKPIWFINTSRGKIVKIEALLKAIDNNKILGAALDVLEQEPPIKAPWFNSLISNDKILLTPHVAGWSKESYTKISELLANKILDLYGNT